METSVITALAQIRRDLLNGNISTSGELANALRAALEIDSKSFKLPRFAPSETPSSVKFNAVAAGIEKAISDRDYVFDLLLAAAIHDYDVAQMMLDDLENRVFGLIDSVKTLYFYTKPPRSGLHVVGADFTVGNGVFTDKSNTLHRLEGAGLTLPVIRSEVKKITPRVEGDGIPGAYFLLQGSPPQLMGSILNCAKEDYLGDYDPTTWFEYERFKIKPQDLATTLGYGWGFESNETVWASPDYNDINLTVTFNFQNAISTNYISITPAENAADFTVADINLSLSGVSARTVPTNGLVINKELMMHTQDGYANGGYFTFEPTICDQVTLKFRSTAKEACRIRHHYRLDDDGNRIPSEAPSSSDPEFLVQTSMGAWKDFYEDFSADRFCIAIKDISIMEVTYGTEGFAISEAVGFSKPIDRVAITSNMDVPEGCSVIHSVSLDKQNWYEINPLGTSVKDQILAVNDLIPDAYREPSTKYISASGDSSILYARISMDRAKGIENTTPIIRYVEIETTLKT
jgi:hypothetical protein